MNKGAVALITILILSIPLAYPISIKELLARYNFFAVTAQMNVTSYADFMIDGNNNGINDTLVFELATNNAAGSFIFVISLFDKNGIITNRTTLTLSSGGNKLNITLSSTLLTQNQFNYSIKIYNLTHSLKYRKDNIPTQNYSRYEEGFRVLNIQDSKSDKTLKINVTINSPINGTHVTTLFLSYNSSTIISKDDKTIANSINHLLFNFDNETLKRTHYVGNFTVTSVKVGRKTIKTNFTTAFYDFKDFAAKSYISGFTDSAASSGTNSKYDNLQINVNLQITEADNYNIVLGLYDLFGNLVEQKNVSYFLNAGSNTIPISVNGSKIYEKKLNGPFAVKYAELYQNNALIDKISNAYTTSNYNFNDFNNAGLPDLKVKIDVSDGYHYGINNISINFTIKNVGYKPAFNIFAEIFDNKTFSHNNMSDVLNANSQVTYQFNFANISDFEISAIADSQNFVEEFNESNNAERFLIKLNKRPNLTIVKDITVNETDKIVINLSASEPNGDNLSYSINLSKFSKDFNVFEWKTTTTESGNYILSAIASDGFLDDFVVFRIVVLDNPEIDIDNDGINDSVDRLIGDEDSVNTSTMVLTIFLDNSRNLSKLFNGSRKVRLMDGNFTIAEFDFNFSRHKLNLKNFTINKQKGNAIGSLIVRGLALPEGKTKTLYLDKTNPSLNGVCIKEDEVLSISEISGDCDSSNEFKVECDGTLQQSYTCMYNSTLNKYKIQGLRHSGIMQFAYTKPLSESSSTSASGGGASTNAGGGRALECISDWQCSEWLQCINGFKNRKCSDANQCSFASDKPAEAQECVSSETKENPTEIINNLKETSLPKKLAGITGQAVKVMPQIKNFSDVASIIAVMLVFAACYLAIKSVFWKIFK